MKHLATAALLALTTAFAAHADEPQKGGTLNMVVQPEPPTVMLGLNRLGPVSFVGSKIYEGLITFAPDMTPQPLLAKSWAISEDGLTLDPAKRKVLYAQAQEILSRDAPVI